MKSSIHAIALSMLTIAMGAGWLLNTLDMLPGVNWIWTIGLGLAGLLTLALGGVNKFTLVVGPFLIVASFFSILRQRAVVSVDQEAPILVIVLGLLMLIVQLLPIRNPAWVQADDAAR